MNDKDIEEIIEMKSEGMAIISKELAALTEILIDLGEREIVAVVNGFHIKIKKEKKSWREQQ